MTIEKPQAKQAVRSLVLDKKIPAKFQPKGYHIIYEDQDLIVGNKAAGALSVGALWNKNNTIVDGLNNYIRKGNSRSQKSVFVVHRLDQATTGILIYAKTEQAQQYLKNNWQQNTKIYYAVVHGLLKKKSGLIESYLSEDEDYLVHSSKNADDGKLARTEYSVVKENADYSLIKINLLTGKKNQIRVHMSDLGHPVVGDEKYGAPKKFSNLCLHSYSIEFNHPFKKDRVFISAPVPTYFEKLVPYSY